MFKSDAQLKDKHEIEKFIDSQAKKVVAICSQKFAPCKLTLENTFPKFWVLPAKKTYSGKKANFIKGEKEIQGEIVIKGMGAVKRDRCDAAKRICNVVIESILNDDKMSVTDRVLWLQRELAQIPFGKINNMSELAPFILTAELGTEYKQNDSMVPLLANLIHEETGCKPDVGDRLSYVVAYFADTSLLHCHRVVPPTSLLKQGLFLDIPYYLEKQIYSCLKQILCLPCHERLRDALKKCIDGVISKWKMARAVTQRPVFIFPAKRKSVEPS